MKKIIVFGSTGTIGQHIVSQALALGHQVTAFTRNRENVKTSHASLQIAEGDVRDEKAVEKAIAGHDIVFCALGSKSRKGDIRSAGTNSILKGMQKTGVKRFICQTTLGARDSYANLNFFWKRIMFGWFIKEVFLDHEKQERLIEESNLDWIIARPGAFTNGPKTGAYRHGFATTDRTVKLKISRADVADFMLHQIEDNSYLHQTPGLSY